MSVTMICPNLQCGRTVVTDDSARGKVVRCAYCQSLFVVPRDAQPTAEPAQPEPEARSGAKRSRND